MDVMGFGWQAFFYFVGVALFVAAAIHSAMDRGWTLVLVSAGLAVVFFVSAWNAAALA